MKRAVRGEGSTLAVELPVLPDCVETVHLQRDAVVVLSTPE